MGTGRQWAAPNAIAWLFAATLGAGVLAACSGGPSSGGACQSNRDCVAGETCISGVCQAGVIRDCTNDEQCPLGQYCDTNDSVCRTFTSSTADGGVATGDAGSSTVATDGGVGRDSGTGQCMMDSDCGTPPVDICVADQCVKGCNETNGLVCTGGTVCDAPTGHCVSSNPTCQTDSDCNPPTQICIGNSCVFGCGLDSTLCQSGEICDTTTGRCVVVQTNCMNDTECSPPMTICESMQCIPGCAQPGGIQCSGATPYCDAMTGRCSAVQMGGCMLDADCANANEICVNMSCELRCDAPGSPGCISPQVCNATSGRCVQGGLPLGDPCTMDASCQSNFCLSLNINMTNIDVCTTPCGATSNCPIDFTCADVSGMSFCLSENLNNPPATWDTPSGGACSSTSNTCQSGWCNTGQNVCIETCSSNAACASYGGNCWLYEQSGTGGTTYANLCFDPGAGSATGAACTQNSNCRSGICSRYSNTCSQHCCYDADCPANQNCDFYDLDATNIAKICVNKAGTTGNLGFGAACTMPTDCDSEVCAPTDPTMMNSPMKCSTLCCRDSDCSILPAGGVCRPVVGPVTNTITGLCIPN